MYNYYTINASTKCAVCHDSFQDEFCSQLS
eukprot:COSAG01_NODE_49475_length_372_cov_0.443223_2_plen_29_part_01